MTRPLKILAALVVTAVCCAGGIGLLASWNRAQEIEAWPSLDEEPPLGAVVSPADGAWDALLPLLVLPEDADVRIADTIEIEGAPLDPGFWILVADELEALDVILRDHATITPPPMDISAPYPSLLPLMTLARALCLRGWTSYESSDYSAAVDDMLAADALGARLVEGGQSLVAVLIGVNIQQLALRELEEMLDVIDDPDAHRRAAEGLARHAVAPEQVRRAALIECSSFEAMFRSFDDNPALLTERAAVGEPTGEDPPEPGVLDQINALRYDADATIAQHRRNCRAQDEWLAALPVARSPEPPDVMPDVPEQGGYNRIGLTLLAIATPSVAQYADHEHRAALQRSGLRLLTAARRHAYDHGGRLPDDAAALVPAYLPEVFADPFAVSPLAIEGGRIVSGDADLSWDVTMPEGR